MFNKSLRNARRAFTLIEIMIVVLIIGILLAIAVPNFVRARESSRAKACVSNLKQIDSAKEQWAMDNKKPAGDSTLKDTDISTLAGSKLVGPDGYIKSVPTCEAAGTYTVGPIGTNPECSVKANTAASYAPHILP